MSNLLVDITCQILLTGAAHGNELLLRDAVRKLEQHRNRSSVNSPHLILLGGFCVFVHCWC